ncbi:Major facilitator superfamily [Kalmanozyma brasiliensis GHG001]|uniref:Nodulin-like domain-containing protein n=1 Tax=Kalmanozyma brasiliensis (strain GHG001) TaxID=1365824 RepID=V5EW78_KALBG|nr:Major facilitator superfamily [Kalmanozyma brasiliensis GHG001]EST09810.1 Major facilitator superfamily [Kalmanozyma brasiliensis GHG001]
MALTESSAPLTNGASQPLSPEERKRLLRRKIISLAGSVCVALSAGSNYAFSSFAPQLQESLHLTSTQINLIGIAGNAGVYLSSPLWGRFIDKRGPHTALIVAAVLVPIGYSGLSLSYSGDWSLHSTSLLFGLNLLTGLGNSGGFTAAMNAQAKSWGGSRRGTATALVLSGFGLSAFFYSSLSHLLFPGNTGDYLLLLAFGSMTSMLIGLGLIKIIPPIAEPDEDRQDSPQAARDYLRRRTSSDIGARATIWQQPETLSGSPSDDETEAESSRNATTRLDEDGDIDPESQGLLSGRDESKRDSATDIDPAHIDISGRRLFQQLDFYLIFLVMTLVSGAGLLLINNVGTITKTLWDFNHRDNPVLVAASNAPLRRTAFEAMKLSAKSSVQQLQAKQVSAISLCNFSGRIIIGLLSDLLVNRTGTAADRVWLLIVVTTLALASQILAAYPGAIGTTDDLFAVSSLTGLAYGTLFGVCPTLVFEWFGMKHFSQNYGFVSLSPVVAGNVFNLLFGHIYDSHVPQDTTMLATVLEAMKGHRDDHPAARHLCMDGEECYRQVFVVTSIGCALAVVISAGLIWRRARNVPRFMSRG